MSTDMTHTQYHNEIEYLASECLERAIDEQNDDLYGIVHETLDGHEWVIYINRHVGVQDNSENWEYGLDEGLVHWQAGESSFSELTMALSFWAMVQDTMEVMEELKDLKADLIRAELEQAVRDCHSDDEDRLIDLLHFVEDL